MSTFLLIGGVRSGKSSWAVRYADRYNHKTYIATAEPCDDEMRERIRRHQEERGEGWTTIEAGKNINDALHQSIESSDCIVIDCLTVWTALIMNEEPTHDAIIEKWINPILHTIENTKADIVIVTNEVGMGVHPEYESGRIYRDLLGTINQRFAQTCNHVYLFVAGIPTAIKGTLHHVEPTL
jgi:adenosylcobinamide kinase/adenosylcobinamide-phosphate guanylyltransferase